jgi:asparagine synthetase A
MDNREFLHSLFKDPTNRSQFIDTEKPGRTIREIMDELSNRIVAEDERLKHERFYVRQGLRDQPWPQRGAIACYAVRGSNEGYYVHIEVINRRDEPKPTSTLMSYWKLWDWKTAMEVAMRSTILLDAVG